MMPVRAVLEPIVKIGGRTFTKVANAALQPRHYTAALNMARICDRPVDVWRRYVWDAGAYPCHVGVRTPIGHVDLQLFTRDDVLSLNEIFCRNDYASTADQKTFVDWGSNIGVSGAYFLTRSSDSFVYLFEPLPQNVERLKSNLARFEGRFSLSQTAVAPYDGIAKFGWEPTGRYGGIGQDTGRTFETSCVDSNRVLREIIAQRGSIDVLKVDIETLESEIVGRIPPEIARKIATIYVEYRFSPPHPLESTHAYSQRGSIARFRRMRGVDLNQGTQP
jgi:FkbM family methyltransferase